MLDKWKSEWPHISKIVKVTRLRQKANVDAEASVTESYYVSNHNLTAGEFAKYIREHWFVENKLHHVKDSTFREDFSMKIVKPFVFSCIVDFAMLLLKHWKISNFRDAIYRFSLDCSSLFEKFKTSPPPLGKIPGPAGTRRLNFGAMPRCKSISS
jgi:predicted transposase YbfD/YdcC